MINHMNSTFTAFLWRTGLLKRGFVKEEMKGQLNILKLIKGLLDSKNILNPGKLLE